MTPLLVIIHYIVPISCLASALILGGWPERCAAVTMLVGGLASALIAVNTWTALEVGLFCIDVAALVALWSVALMSDRFWPYYVTAFQLLTVYGHVQAILFNDPLPWSYGMLSNYASIPMFVILGLASAFGWQQRTIERAAK
ncbi:MAG: hypothetical protein IT553_02535 [Sphingomonadaceae bacterium]|nr:hypothetical protein [Sphingomonadaceae bacterium]